MKNFWLIGCMMAVAYGIVHAQTGEEAIVAATTEETSASAKPASDTKENTMVIIKTSMGDIKLKLYDAEAPITVKNFLEYVDGGHYNGTIFHRVIGNFMIQGGGFTPEMEQKPTKAPIKNEAANGRKNMRGTIAMARTQVIDSATSQFFINVVNNDFLNYRDPSMAGYGYCVFGEVVEGMDVVDQIKAVKTGNLHGFSDVPKTTVKIIEVVRAAE